MKVNLINRHIPVHLILAITSVIMLLPFVVMLLTSFKGDEEFNLGTNALLPLVWHPENYVRALQVTEWGIYFKNSIIVTVVTVAGSLFFNMMAGYTFARMTFRGRDIIFILLLVGLMVPSQVTIIPQFLILKSIPLFGGNDLFGNGGNGWLDSYYALIIPELSGSFGIFLARQFYLQFPKALDDAASIDGAGAFRSFLRIYLPQSGPLLATLGIFKTVYIWNDFFHPLIYTNSESMRTIQLGLQVFNGQYHIQYNLLMAATVVVSLPLAIMFFVFQKQFIKSLISSSVKG
ncbi:carbohydrate ABC transporter permease [Paenibacillus cremeus]|uniref:Carbohydrate ABC transporter permease n=1 Tax=Paenibacillus cremeus TaxID=2163881 RepID=A0A559JZQ9_9BACL|nr:carbohydrate ABC transporter permease [Paenibacillus cremeus]TVY05371.1 carbohydrate ABC transporter permease [Paenibacillus cremeus]